MLKQYFPFREEYRNLITDLVLKCDNDSWNNWIKFNLRRIEDAICVNTDRVEDMYEDQLIKYRRMIRNIIKDYN